MKRAVDQDPASLVSTGYSARLAPRESPRPSRLIWRRPLAAGLVTGLSLGLSLPALSQSELQNPEEIHYDGGNIKITASKQPVEWQGHHGVMTNVYSAHYKKDYAPSYTPPTIHVNSGTTLNILLTSQIDYTRAVDCDEPHNQYTNLHYHGFEVSPRAPQDDVVTIKVTDKPYQYEVVLPPGHPEGMFWYHPHPHGCSYFQVNGGMSGILIVGDILKRQYPELDGIKERILLLKDGDPRPAGALEQEMKVMKFAANEEPEPDPITVNGVAQPVISIRTGEKQFFRIGNVGANFFVKLAFDPPVKATIVAVDGMATDKGLLLPEEGWLLPPGSRVEMVVDGPKPGPYKLISKEIPKAMSPPGGTVLATLKATAVRTLKANAAGTKALDQGPRARGLYYPQNQEFAAAPVPDGCDVHSKPAPDPRTQGCTFVFSQGSGEFRINGKMYEEGVNDVTCKIGKDIVYDWTLCNDTAEYHAFHIHQIHFEVVDIDGQPVIAPIRDVVDLPPRHADKSVSRTHIKMAFQHDYLAGKFVFHCHMLTHEDKGMMMNIELVK